MASPMVQMSRAIRLTLQANSATEDMRGVPTEALKEFHSIVTAFQMDIADELARRAAVASEAPPPKE